MGAALVGVSAAFVLGAVVSAVCSVQCVLWIVQSAASEVHGGTQKPTIKYAVAHGDIILISTCILII